MSRRTSLVFLWEQFGPYHIDRCNAVAAELGARHPVIGLELAERSPSHLWDRPPAPTAFRLVTLFKGGIASRSRFSILLRLLREAWRSRPGLCFVCHYERVEIFAFSLLLRVIGVPLVTMLDSKFDDKPRGVFREALKSFFLLPYGGAMVSGARSREYMEFLGFRSGAIVEGCDTVSMDRVSSLAGLPPAPEGQAYRDRHFTIVARLVGKKNLFTALDAYARYRAIAGPEARSLQICGDGPLRAALVAEVERSMLEGVLFCGALQPPQISLKLAQSLALILPSTEEQWGLVANEAVALGLPLLLSTNCGARDSLLRTGVNGFIYEPDNPAGLAYFMNELGTNETLWRRMCHASLALRPVADSRRFQQAVSIFLDRFIRSTSVERGSRPRA